MFGREPVAITSAIRLVLYAVIALGWARMTDTQIGAVLAAVEAVLLLVARQNVASPATLRDAGTSLQQVRAAAQPDIDAQLRIVGPDAAQAPK
jgi:hypothetical protein